MPPLNLKDFLQLANDKINDQDPNSSAQRNICPWVNPLEELFPAFLVSRDLEVIWSVGARQVGWPIFGRILQFSKLLLLDLAIKLLVNWFTAHFWFKLDQNWRLLSQFDQIGVPLVPPLHHFPKSFWIATMVLHHSSIVIFPFRLQ